MANRRERGPRRRNGKAAWSLLTRKSVPAGDFLPPGFSAKVPKPEDASGEVTTYFLHTEKRGIARYLPVALEGKSFQKGFRGVIVTKTPLVFDQRNAKLAGRLSGDHFEVALEWAKRSILDELQNEYVRGGGGTKRDRERTATKFFRALKRRDELDKKSQEAELELERASIDMVKRFGKQPFVLEEEGVTLDACSGPGDKVYWRSRGGK